MIFTQINKIEPEVQVTSITPYGWGQKFTLNNPMEHHLVWSQIIKSGRRGGIIWSSVFAMQLSKANLLHALLRGLFLLGHSGVELRRFLIFVF